MRKLILGCAITASTLLAFSANAQVKATSAAKSSLQKAYPAAKNVKWEKEDGNFEAGFLNKGKETSLVIDANGKVLETETAIEIKALPSEALTYLKSKFGKSLKIKDAASIVKADGTMVYEADVKGMDYLFDAKGKFIKTAKD